MKKHSMRKLTIHRETLFALAGRPEALQHVVGGTSERSMCGTCPPGTCMSRRVESACLAC